MPTEEKVAAVEDLKGRLQGVKTVLLAEYRGLTVRQLSSCRELVAHADMVVVDGNIPPAVTAWLLDYAAAVGVPVVLEPVSVVKGWHLAATLNPARPVLAITPNLDELSAIVEAPVPNTRQGIERAARAVHARGVEHVWVRRGLRGSILSSRGEGGRPAATTLQAPPATPST